MSREVGPDLIQVTLLLLRGKTWMRGKIWKDEQMRSITLLIALLLRVSRDDCFAADYGNAGQFIIGHTGVGSVVA